ncbi:MAG: hypothetical protein ABF746_08635 [Acetobacter orientalis]|uniref:hypothetical protein n=1 Tax=Acetobacter orientalis TaxID=146474 RepID=UPI0039E87AD7
MNLEQYLHKIVEPTVKDYYQHPNSERHAFLACVVIYHSVDYAAYKQYPTKKISTEWNTDSIEFALVDIVANHMKHVKSMSEKHADSGKIKGCIPLYKLIIDDLKDGKKALSLHNLYFCIRDSLAFVKKWSEENKSSEM